MPFAPTADLDLDKYVTSKSVDGLFHMLGEEEKKIRTDPAARATDLLKKVFGRSADAKRKLYTDMNRKNNRNQVTSWHERYS